MGRGISTAATLTFGSLSPADEGMYRCTSNFASPYLIGTRTVMETVTVLANREFDCF